MTTGRRPKPTHLKVVAGNPGRRPLPANEAKPPPITVTPEPPEHLSAVAKAEWILAAPRLITCGLLTVADLPVFAAYCDAFAQWVQAREIMETIAAQDPQTRGLVIRTSNGNAIQNPVLGTLRTARHDMVRFALEFGMSPASRSRIDIGIGGGGFGPGGGTLDPTESRFFGR